MQDFIAALLAILGTLLVLAGATVTVAKTVAVPATEPEAAGGRRILSWISRANGADRLVAWGVLLLVLAAIASGAISFNFGASAGTR
ncbi:hypothetical protein Rhe02_88160 [Rhizocola hellebori]|uniref:Uncharacterized protein n=1 Tax=Rhizocola hellebori TaxID=1392758 RepID=A0A8J3VKR2_9ACTN|nr:hypothetical protein [Rhizocola hellebori]GIH10749.1 hypothetical protein Rhe02_88160 [Rhizocola hellebori]